MKVAHLTTVDLSLRFLVLPQLLSIKALGGEVLGISSPGPWVPELEEAGIRHVPLVSSTRGVAPLADLRATIELWRLMRRERPDIIHTHNPKPGLYGRIVGRLTGVPIVVNTVHGIYAAPDDPLLKRIVVYLLEALAARFSDAELVQSSEDLQLMDRLRLAPRGRAHLLGNGISLTSFDPGRWTPSQRQEVRRSLGIGADQIVVGMVGRLVAEKGYPEFFDAIAQLDDRYVALAIGPDDPEKADALDPAIIARAEANGVRFLGMRSDLDRLYPAMDIFVLPSHREGFPRAAMEAAASGLPVIATDIRGCREVVDHGVNGLLTPVNDPTSLAQAISSIGGDARGRAAMGEAGRQKALTSFDEERVVEIVLETYRSVSRRKGLSRLTESLGSSPAPVIRRGITSDAAHLARMHIDGISGGFLPRLGHRFLTVLYRALSEWPEGVVLVADSGSGPVGFVAGVTDTAAFYRHFARRCFVPAALSAAPALTKPANWRRAFETRRYGGDAASGAELLSMAVDEEFRGRGIGLDLGTRFLDALRHRGTSEVRVVVGAGNHAAQQAYVKMGFVDADVVEVHPGEPSKVMAWSSPPS